MFSTDEEGIPKRIARTVDITPHVNILLQGGEVGEKMTVLLSFL